MKNLGVNKEVHRMRIDLFEEIKRLKRDVEYYKQQAEGWKRKYFELKKEFDEVKKLLNQFLNANTPSSKLPFSFKNINREPKGTNPRGKPQGSNGATREEPDKIDDKIEVNAKQCPKIG